MSWESRKSGGRYFTTSRRISGRIVREYFGNGPLAELANQTAEIERLRRQAEREALQSAKQSDAMHNASLDEFLALTDALNDAILICQGWHKHKRGQWRKRREQNTSQ